MEYFAKKGAVDVLAELSSEPKMFGELQREVNVSSATLSKRLDEAQEIGLIKKTTIEPPGGEMTVGYRLSLLGFVIYKLIEREGLMSLIEKKNRLESEIEEIQTKLRDSTEDILDEVDDTDINSEEDMNKMITILEDKWDTERESLNNYSGQTADFRDELSEAINRDSRRGH
jgi:DNA-binding HxlR family transcriptional regulator